MAKEIIHFHVIYGDEDFLVDRALENKRKLWRKQGRVLTVLNGEDATENALISACETQSFFEDELRAVVLDNAQEVKIGKAFDTYVKAKESTTLVCVVYRGATLPKSWSVAVENGSEEHYSKFKPWEQAKVYARTVDEAKRLGLKLGEGVPEMFFKVMGDNLRGVVNELRKLTYLVPEGTLIEPKHVALVVAPDVPVEPWQVAEAALAKNSGKALDLISMLNVVMGESFVVPVTISLQRQVERILVARQMLDKGDGVPVIAAAMDKSEFFCQKNIIPVARRHTVRELIGHMNKLCKLEVQVKGAARSKRTLVELAVLSIAT